MIDPKDFRLNNLVQATYEGVLIVQGIAPDWIYACKEIGLPTGRYHLGSVFPVELSEEWLRKCPEYKGSHYPIDTYKTQIGNNYENGTMVISVQFSTQKIQVAIGRGGENMDYIFLPIKKYLHEFQNFHFTITGKELMIQP